MSVSLRRKAESRFLVCTGGASFRDHHVAEEAALVVRTRMVLPSVNGNGQGGGGGATIVTTSSSMSTRRKYVRLHPRQVLLRVYLCSALTLFYLALGMTISGLATSGALIRILQQGTGSKEGNCQQSGTG